MKDYISSSTDIRQSVPWGKYMESIGWHVIQIDRMLVYIKEIKFYGRSMVKIQHPKGKINFKKLEKEVKKYKPVFLVVEPHVYQFKESDFLKNGFKKSKLHFAPTSTIKIDITKNEDEIFSSFSENARRNIKKSKKNNLTVKIIDLNQDRNLQFFDDYYNLVKSLTNKKSFYAPGYEESIKKMNAFKNNSVLVFAYENNEPIAVVWLGYFDKTITYMQTGINEKGYKSLANYLLVWDSIRWAKRKGLKVFDFESIYDSRNPRENKRWIGFSEFKKRFHGEIINYPPSYVKYYSLVFRFLEIFSR